MTPRDSLKAIHLSEDFHQAALTLGEMTPGEFQDARALATLAELAHRDSADPWFRIAILSSVADRSARGRCARRRLL